MELVNVNLYACAYYSGSKYEDNIWIKKSSYEKLKDVFPEEISCGELDGKHSEIFGDVEIQDRWETDEDYAKAGIASCDGDTLENSLIDLYNENGLDWEEEQKEIKEYFDNLDVWEDVTVSIPSSKKIDLMAFVDTLNGEYNNAKVISKDEYDCIKTMTNDLLKAEEYINTLGVATRNPDNDDEFRTMHDVLKDVVTVWNNNPTIRKDIEKFLSENHMTSDESEEFLRHYNLDGITRNR